MVTRTVRFALSMFLLALLPLATATAQEATTVVVGTPADTGDEELDFASLEGVQRAVARYYAGDFDFFGTPAPTSTGIVFIVATVVAFDQDDHASTAVETINDDFLASTTADPTLTVEEVDAGELGERTMAYTATGEEAGTTTEISLVLTQNGFGAFHVVPGM